MKFDRDALRAWLEDIESEPAYRNNPLLGPLRWLAAQYQAQLLRENAGASNIKTTREQEFVEALNAANRARFDLLAVIGHEVRTPLHGILGAVELLHGTALDDLQREHVDTLEYAARALFLLLDNILDQAAGDDLGSARTCQEEFDLFRLVHSLASLHGTRAREKGLDLQVHFARDVPQRVTGDAGRLGQVLLNLLENSVKYTESGRVELDVRKADGRSFCFEVIDTGIGTDVSPTRLFERYQRGEAEVVRGYSGKGLGLSICRQLVKIMGGEITFDSRRGAGTRVKVVLPLGEPVRDADRLASALTVLLVEDEPTNRSIVSKLLRKRGHTVEAVASGAEALDRLARWRCDVVVMDLVMPGLSGIETMRALHARGAHPPVLAFSADSREQSIQDALAAGFASFIAKPVSIERLDCAMRRVVAGDLHRLTEPMNTDEALVDGEALLQLRDDLGPEALRQAVRIFKKRSADYLADLRAAARVNDPVQVSKLAHALAGAAGIVGLKRLAQHAQQLSERAVAEEDLGAATRDLELLVECSLAQLAIVVEPTGTRRIGRG